MSPAQHRVLDREASFHASRLVATSLFNKDEHDDLSQELLLDCFRRRKWFNASRGEWQTFVRHVMRNCASGLLNKRRKRARAEMLVDPSVGLEQFADQSQGSIAGYYCTLDIYRVLDLLPPRLRDVARELESASVTEICQRTGQSRSQLYRMIRKLREAFKQRGYGCLSRARKRMK